MEIPPWTPQVLSTIWEIQSEKMMDGVDLKLLQRLIFDSRMRKVWIAIGRRTTPNSVFPFHLLAAIDYHLRLPTNCCGEKTKNYLTSILEQCRDAKASLESLPERMIVKNAVVSLSRQIMVIELVLISIRESESIQYESFGLSKTYLKNPLFSILARLLFTGFTTDLGTPLWDTIATLIEVVLDLPSASVHHEMIRSCCRGVDPPELNLAAYLA